jgi:hypothetical protein
MATDANLIKGAQSVAAAKSLTVKPGTIGAGISKGISEAKKGIQSLADAQIAEKKENDKKLLEYADQRTTIDMSAVTDPEYRDEISRYLTAGKQKYSEGANQAVANSEDPFGDEYGAGKKIMQDVNDHTAVTVKQIAKFDQLRNQFQAQITENGGLPFGLSEKDRDIATAIFTGTANMKIDDKTGKISFVVNGDTIELDTYKFPTDEKPEAEKFELNLTAKYLEDNKPIKEGELEVAEAGFLEQLGTVSALTGVLADKMGPAPTAEQQRTPSQKEYQRIQEELDKGKDTDGEYTSEALEKARKATAAQMAKDLQTKVNKNFEDKLLYTESFTALENGTISEFQVTGTGGVRYTIIRTPGEGGGSDTFMIKDLNSGKKTQYGGPYESLEELKQAIPDIVNKIK